MNEKEGNVKLWKLSGMIAHVDRARTPYRISRRWMTHLLLTYIQRLSVRPALSTGRQ